MTELLDERIALTWKRTVFIGKRNQFVTFLRPERLLSDF